MYFKGLPFKLKAHEIIMKFSLWNWWNYRSHCGN